MSPITYDVLSERQDQQHTQVMLLLAKIDNRLANTNGSMHAVQILGVEHEQRIEVVETQLEYLKRKEEETQERSWKIAVAVALLTGLGMAGGNAVLGLITP